MRRRAAGFSLAALGVALLAGCGGGAGAGGEATVGTASPAGASAGLVGSLETIRPSFARSGAASIDLIAARNGFASFQVVVQGGRRGVAGVALELGRMPRGPGGEIPREEATIYEERLVELDEASDVEGEAGRWPDPLVPAVDSLYGERRNAFPLDVPAGEARAAWVDIHIPAGAEPGSYAGTITVMGGGLRQDLDFEIEVIDVELQSGPLLDSAFGLRGSECAAHGVDCTADPERGWMLRALYVRSALENRIGPSDPALSVGTPTDSELFRRYALPLIRGESLPGEGGGGELRTPRLSGARPSAIRVDDDVEWWRAEALAGGFESRALSYPCDEPGTDGGEWERCIDGAEAARAVWPGLRTLVTASVEGATAAGALAVFDVVATLVNDLEGRPDGLLAGDSMEAARRFVDDGGVLWAYNSCRSHGCDGVGDESYAGWPSYAIDQPGSSQRAMGPLAAGYDLPGELYYALNRDLATAWTPQPVFGGNGDGTLFYPGRTDLIGGSHDIPIESIRMKRIRDGREDYALLSALARQGRPALARRLARDLVPHTYETDVAPARYDRFRRRIAAALGR